MRTDADAAFLDTPPRGSPRGMIAPAAPPPCGLDAAEVDELLATIHESVQVRRRYQFFVWSQGRLRALLPHGVLVCGLPLPGSGRMFFDYFYNVPLEPAALSRLCHPRNGLVAEMIDPWLAGGGEPMALTGTHANGTTRLVAEMKSLGLTDGLAHGIPSARAAGNVHCFFAFVALPNAPGARDTALMHLLVPHLFGAYCRALTRDQPSGASGPADEAELSVTEREIEILRWVREGKSNQEIGLILSISPLTVKNHVQKILRKLQASNRAQAVSKAIALRLLGSSGARRDSDLVPDRDAEN